MNKPRLSKLLKILAVPAVAGVGYLSCFAGEDKKQPEEHFFSLEYETVNINSTGFEKLSYIGSKKIRQLIYENGMNGCYAFDSNVDHIDMEKADEGICYEMSTDMDYEKNKEEFLTANKVMQEFRSNIKPLLPKNKDYAGKLMIESVGISKTDLDEKVTGITLVQAMFPSLGTNYFVDGDEEGKIPMDGKVDYIIMYRDNDQKELHRESDYKNYKDIFDEGDVYIKAAKEAMESFDNSVNK
jgi:hypothetical protein